MGIGECVFSRFNDMPCHIHAILYDALIQSSGWKHQDQQRPEPPVWNQAWGEYPRHLQSGHLRPQPGFEKGCKCVPPVPILTYYMIEFDDEYLVMNKNMKIIINIKIT